MGLPLTRDMTFVTGVSTIPASTLNAIQDAIVGMNTARFGDGSDGALAFDGVSAVAGASGPSAGVYTLVRDLFATSLTLTGTAVLYPANFRIFVNGILTTNGRQIVASGKPGSGAFGGIGNGLAAAGTLIPVNGGGNGGTSAAGLNGGIQGGLLIGGLGGAGGAGSSTAGGAIPAANLLTTNPSMGSPRAYSASTFGYVAGQNPASFSTGLAGLSPLAGGSSGAGGGGSAGNSGGGGGAGGELIAIAAKSIVLTNATDLISAGGAGAAAVGSNAGGGGGGGGGGILLVYSAISVASGTLSGATNCPGGAGGAKTGTGVAGTAGATGAVIQVAI